MQELGCHVKNCGEAKPSARIKNYRHWPIRCLYVLSGKDVPMSLRQLSIQWKITLLAGLCLLGIVTLLVGLSLYRMAQSSQ